MIAPISRLPLCFDRIMVALLVWGPQSNRVSVMGARGSVCGARVSVCGPTEVRRVPVPPDD